MGLLDNTTQKAYYDGEQFGSYQFTSLDDIITQFQIAYVGESKIIPKVKRTDVAFHAMRAMQEFSFDTFKSVKSQEIVLPPSLKMILPHDYVNYTQVSWVDTKGIKHPIYPTKHTSNPFSILQEDDGSYDFPDDLQLVTDSSFDKTPLPIQWKKTSLNLNVKNEAVIGVNGLTAGAHTFNYTGGMKINSSNGSLEFSHTSVPTKRSNVTQTPDPLVDGIGVVYSGKILAAWHRIDVRDMEFLDFGATVNVAVSDTNQDAGEVVVAIQETPGQNNIRDRGTQYQENSPNFLSKNLKVKIQSLAYLEWGSAEAGTDTLKEKTLNVAQYDFLYFMITSRVQFQGAAGFANLTQGTSPTATPIKNLIKSVNCKNNVAPDTLQHRDPLGKDSSAWDSYKSSSNSTNDSYSYDQERNLHLNEGRRYGLSPEHAQENGSFYIDNLKGQINFSSTISGKTIILDYISDSLGTDEEMQVHKFAEEAMYKSILCDIMSTRQNVPEYAIRRYKQDKRASKRNAKLRLSNIKPNEIIQIFRNKSKQIK